MAAAVAAALPRSAEATSWTTLGGLNCWDGDKGGIRIEEANYDHHNPVHDEGERLEELTLDECKARCAAEDVCQGVLTIHRHILPGEPDKGPCWLRKSLQPSECMPDTPWDLHVLSDRGSFSASSFGAAAGFDCTAGVGRQERGWSDQKKAYCCDHDGVGCGRRGWLAACSAAAGVPEWMMLVFIVLISLTLCLLVCLLIQAYCVGGKAASRDALPAPAVAQIARKDPVLRLGVAGGSLGVDAPGYGPMVVSQSHQATADSWEYGRRPLGQPLTSAWLTRYSARY